MRLINIHTLEMKEFFSEVIQKRNIKYAILSHTWGEEEISFADWTFITENPDSTKATNLRLKAGYRKIEGFLRRVRELSKELREDDRQLDWAWVDTCGIDKRSSAELSEAINSMYAWYQRAYICYAYLSDVHEDDVIDAKGSDFRQSRWFTRGWTLQELIAPENVEFLNQNWNTIGSKKKDSTLLQDITGVPFSEFRRPSAGFAADNYSFAQKMSWAASRETTREEDLAYCLLGLFGINMPLIYGEGHRSFLRLQEEIVKKSADHTILAWRCSRNSGYSERSYTSIFARSPAYFSGCSGIVRGFYYDPEIHDDLKGLGVSQPFGITNFGVRIHLPLVSCSKIKYLENLHSEPHCFSNCILAILLCVDLTKGSEYVMAINIGHTYEEENQYGRVCAEKLEYLPAEQTIQALQSKIDDGKFAEEIYLAVYEEQDLGYQHH